MGIEHCHIRLLGALQIKQDGKTETQFRSRRAIALLVYLITNNRPIPRSELVELIWPDKTEKQGRGNLRWVLNYLSKIIPEALEKNRRTVQFSPLANNSVDVNILAQAIASNDHDQLSALLIDVQGEFMSGFYFDESAEFETWLITQRETWRLKLLQALETQINYLANTAQYATALQLAEKWLTTEPWAEPAHRWKMRLLARTGATADALEQYKRCWRILAEELGTEPTDETTALFLHLQETADQPRHNLPTQPTTFVGRQSELAEIAQLIQQADIRLLTIVGPGGMGKTRLAIKAGEQLAESFIDGAVLVELTHIHSADDIPTAILSALDESTTNTAQQSGNDPRRILQQLLHDKELLLILDNFEHVITGANYLVTLLQTTPLLKIIVTSRERLNLRWERLIEINGFPAPAAFTFFVQSAKRARSTFKVVARNRQLIKTICHLVEGMPLAIELAAAWVRMQTCEQIAGTIRNDLDFLAGSQRDMPDRHRSVRAVFESSWRLLPSDEQERLAKLAVFIGGFSAESARQVTGASWLSLAPLVDKSLITQTLSATEHGTLVRYSIHELLRQFSAEKLSQQHKEATQAALATYFCHYLHERTQLIQQGNRRALNEIGREIANIKQAWEWSLTQVSITNFTLANTALAYFFDMRSRWKESIQAFEPLITTLRQLADSVPQAYQLLGTAALSLGNSYTRAMQFADADRILREGLLILRQINHHEGEAFALFALARVRNMCGDDIEATDFYQQSLTLAIKTDDLLGMARARVNLASTAMQHGKWVQAHELATISRTQFEQQGDQRGSAVAILNLALSDFAQGNLSSARELTTLSYQIATQINAVSMIGGTRQVLATLDFCEGKLAEADKALVELHTLFSNIGDDSSVITVWKIRGDIAIQNGNIAEAAQHANHILQLSQHLDFMLGLVKGHQLAAAVALAHGETDSAEINLHKALKLVKSGRRNPLKLSILADCAKAYHVTHPEKSATILNLIRHHPATHWSLLQQLPQQEDTAASTLSTVDEAIEYALQATKLDHA